jgi:uncharacterized protein YecT (DUF1311 family)
MFRVSLAVIFALGLMTAGCGQKAVDCGSADARDAMDSLVRGEIEKSAIARTTRTDGTRIASDAKVRATVALLKIVFEDIRTTKKDPDSTKRFCTATIKVVVPLNILADADKARQLAELTPISALATSSNVDRSADSFTYSMEYNVQPTDDGKKVYAEMEAEAVQIHFFGEVLASHLARTQIEGEAQAQANEAAAAQAAEQQAIQDSLKANLDLVTAENNLATQRINELWRSLPDDARAQALEYQRAWIKKKVADCNIEAASTSTEPTEREIARLQCDTRITVSRANELEELRQSY